MSQLTEKKTPEWTMKNLDVALAKLKNKKSRDFEGYSNEIFKNDVIGSDLKMSLLIMFNKIKSESYLPNSFGKTQRTFSHLKHSLLSYHIKVNL